MSKLKLKKKRHKENILEDDDKNDNTRYEADKNDDNRDEAEIKMDEEVRISKVTQMGINSASKHNIRLEPGRRNPADGNCSYESVIFNINDRECFDTTLPMSPDFYRRVWTIDLMNKILDNKIPWNPGMTRQEIHAGFQEIMESGVYERSYFGDMMMAGIACGVKKRILIFNTNENIKDTGHDPIAVVDPRDYGSEINSEIPVVVAYNLVHFESLHPVDEIDIQETIKLTNSYSTGDYENAYGFTRCDMPYLISKSVVYSSQKNVSQDSKDDQSPQPKKQKMIETAQNKVPDATKKILKILRKMRILFLTTYVSREQKMAR